MGSDQSKSFHQFIRDLGFYSIAGVVPSLLGIIALVAFTHVFDAETYGQYALAMVFVSILSTGVFDWLRQAVLRYNPNQDILPTTISLLLALSISLLTIGTLSFSLIEPSLGDFSKYYFAILLAIIAIGVFNVYCSIFQAELQANAVMKFKILRGVLRHGLGLFISVYILKSIVGWIWGAFIGSFISILIMTSQLSVGRVSINKDVLNKMLRYGIPMIGWLFGFTLLTFIDRLFIEFLQGTRSVGIYTANYTLVQTGLPLALVPIIETVHPMIMNHWDGENKQAIKSLISRYSRYFLLIGTPAMVFAAIISKPLSYLALGLEYHEGFLIIPIIGVSLFIWNFSMLGHKGLEVLDSTGTMTLGVFLSVITNIVLNYALIPDLGYIGAAWATLASTTCYGLFAYLTSFRTVRWTVPSKTVLRTGLCGSIMAGIGYVGYMVHNLPVVAPLTAGIFSIVAYILLIILLGEVKREELDILLNQI